MSSFHRHFFRS